MKNRSWGSCVWNQWRRMVTALPNGSEPAGRHDRAATLSRAAGRADARWVAGRRRTAASWNQARVSRTRQQSGEPRCAPRSWSGQLRGQSSRRRGNIALIAADGWRDKKRVTAKSRCTDYPCELNGKKGKRITDQEFLNRRLRIREVGAAVGQHPQAKSNCSPSHPITSSKIVGSFGA